MSENWLFAAFGFGAFSLGVALWLYRWVKKQDAGTERAQEVASWIREGSRSYLRRLYMALGLVSVALGVVIAIVFSFDVGNLGDQLLPER